MSGLRRLLKSYWPVILIALVSLAKFWNLGGSILLGDPDEWTHWEVAKSFSSSIFPSFSGGAWYYSLPLFPLLSFLVNQLGRWWGISSLDTGFVGLRLVSVLFSIALSLGIFFYTKSKAGVWAGFGASLIFCLHPFATHFSRLGLLEAPVTALCFLSFFAYDVALSKKHKGWALLSGLLLALAILTKYTALILVAFYILKLLFSWLFGLWFRFCQQGLKNSHFWQQFFTFSLVDLLPLVVSGFFVSPILFFYYLNDPFNVKTHTLVNLVSWERFTGARLWIGENYFTLSNAFWWLGWLLLLLTLAGIILTTLSKQRRIFLNLAFFAVLSTLLVIIREPFYPRYFLFLIPLFCIFAGPFFGWLVERFNLLGIALGFLILTLFLPGFALGLRSSQSSILNKVAEYSAIGGSEILLSNYWPHIVSQERFVCATWLAEDPDQTKAFCPEELRPASKIIQEDGGVVVIEDLYSSAYISPIPSRHQAVASVREKRKPDRIVEETGTNFPYFKSLGRRLEIYIFAD